MALALAALAGAEPEVQAAVGRADDLPLELLADDIFAEVFGNDSTQYCEMFKCTAGERGSQSSKVQQWEIETLSIMMPTRTTKQRVR